MKGSVPSLPGILLLLGLGSTVLVDPSDLPDVVVCWSRMLFDIPCPACGLTRSLFLIGHARFGEAWALNPFGFPVYGVLLLWGMAFWTSWRPRWMAGNRWFREALWVPGAVVLMWLLWVVRMGWAGR